MYVNLVRLFYLSIGLASLIILGVALYLSAAGLISYAFSLKSISGAFALGLGAAKPAILSVTEIKIIY